MAVWIIEDDDDHTILLQRQLDNSSIQHPHVHFATCEAALHHYEQGGLLPVVILLDLTFPGGMTGQAFMKRIRGTALAGAAVIVTSGAAQHLEEMLRLGAKAYLEKPILGAHLENVFERLGLPKG